MSKSNFLVQVEQHVRALYAARSGEDNLYHNLYHTTEVVKVARDIALSENLSKDDTEVILIAAWFHDTGHFHCCMGHEYQSAEYARDYLERKSYPKEKIEIIINCIKATVIPHQPKNKLEEIICDADLHHLGMNDIEEKGELLRKEYEIKGIKKLSEVDWLKTSIDFFSKHKFFTSYAKKEFGTQKNNSKLKLESKLKKLTRT